MITKKNGYTLIEVALFLAITALLFVGIAAGVNSAMTGQRDNDAVQNYAEFLKSVYSQVINVEGDKAAGGGTGDKAIYGKWVNYNGGIIKSYTVTGDITYDTGNTLEKFKNVSYEEGIQEEYKPRWGSKIQYKNDSTGNFVEFKGSLLVIRDPETGAVKTYINNNSLSTLVNDGNKKIVGGFNNDGIVFCVNTDGVRRGVKIVKGAKNASGVEVLSPEAGDCK